MSQQLNYYYIVGAEYSINGNASSAADARWRASNEFYPSIPLIDMLKIKKCIESKISNDNEEEPEY